jgi:hypothetical protein
VFRTTFLIALSGFAFSLQAEPVNFQISTAPDEAPEGPGVMRNYFSVGKQRMAFRMPQHCTVTSDASNITVFVNENGASGQFSVSNSSFTPDADFTAKVDDYQKASEATLPKEAENVDFKGGRFDQYTINDWKCVSFEWTYSFFAHPTQRQMAYINVDKTHQVALVVIADDTSWKQTIGMAQHFVKSWYWLENPNAPAAH